MPSEPLDAVRQRFHFTEWRGINRLDQEALVRDVELPADLAPGLDPSRIRHIDPGDGTRLLRASWTVPGDEAAALVMDLRICPSREAAHDVLLELLANMQAPNVRRLDDDQPGDIAFSRDPDSALVFARANIAVSIRNGGENVVPVGRVASAVDDWIIEAARR